MEEKWLVIDYHQRKELLLTLFYKIDPVGIIRRPEAHIRRYKKIDQNIKY